MSLGVDEHTHRELDADVIRLVANLIARLVHGLEQRPARQKVIEEGARFGSKAARVAAQVDDQRRRALIEQRFHGIYRVLTAAGLEVIYLDIARLGLFHAVCDGADVIFRAVNGIFVPPADLDDELRVHAGTYFCTHTVNILPLDALAVDGGDDHAGGDSGLGGRRVGIDGDDLISPAVCILHY